MFSKEELKRINTNFWEGFKLYMKGTKSSNGKRINWLNYPTEIKFIYLRLESDNKGAKVCFDIQHKHEELRAIVYEQMTELKVVLENTLCEDTQWLGDHYLLGKKVSRIQWEINNLNFYYEKDHIKIYEFLKKTLVKFDLFYQDYKDILIALTN